MTLEPAMAGGAAGLALTAQPLRLALLVVLLWSAWFLALQLGQRLAKADGIAHRAWLVCASLSVGAGLWVAALFELRLVFDPPAGGSPHLWPSLAALAAASCAGGMALFTTRLEGLVRRLAGAALFALLQFAASAAWAASLLGVDVVRAGAAALGASALALLLVAGAQALALGVWCRRQSDASRRRAAAAAIAFALAGLLPAIALVVALPDLAAPPAAMRRASVGCWRRSPRC